MRLNVDLTQGKIEHKVFFTSDTHFLHTNIIKYSNRPFKDVHEMDEQLIEGWNNIVSVGDEVYHLGDVSLGSPTKTTEILNRLNGKIYLILGNHEKPVLSNQNNIKRFEWIKPVDKLIIENQSIFLSHYAHRVWDKSHRGCIHLYGHSHGSLDGDDKDWGKSMDVGVDNAYRILGEYRPFSYGEIVSLMTKREIKFIDHHNG